METESLSDADRIAGNADVLGTVETEIVSLEGMFTELEKLEGEKIRLTAAVENLTAEETRTLGDDGSSESAVVKKLTDIKGRRDVQSTRLTNIQDKIEAHRSDLAVQGQAVRRAFASVMTQLLVARQTRALAILQELFGGIYVRWRMGRTELKEFVPYMEMVKQIKVVWNRVSQEFRDPVQEFATLQQQPRIWLAEARDLVSSEPGLVLRNIPAKQQPIEQPARELAAV